MRAVYDSYAVKCLKMYYLSSRGDSSIDTAAHNFEIALLGSESYCCWDMTQIKDKTVNLFTHARKICCLVYPTYYIVH